MSDSVQPPSLSKLPLGSNISASSASGTAGAGIGEQIKPAKPTTLKSGQKAYGSDSTVEPPSTNLNQSEGDVVNVGSKQSQPLTAASKPEGEDAFAKSIAGIQALSAENSVKLQEAERVFGDVYREFTELENAESVDQNGLQAVKDSLIKLRHDFKYGEISEREAKIGIQTAREAMSNLQPTQSADDVVEAEPKIAKI